MSDTHTNRLANEKSPYLLQHATNPVDWYPWGDEAFETARALDRPVLLSIGYATCHWCHVMAHESFEDRRVAELMNEAFVCVKVDREERPDVDNLYMTACQMMGAQGGWPLTIVMTPQRRPFFAATYIPRETRFGRIGMLELIPRIAQAWRERRSDLEKMGDQVVEALKQPPALESADLSAATLDNGYEQLVSRFDAVHGGFGDAPKFPTPHNLMFLARYGRRNPQTRSLQMLTVTLDAMRRGGIHDHVGGGFHRYSTDRRWLVPHFEKTLYDQALLLMAYTENHATTGETALLETVSDIAEYVLRDLSSPEGGFYSAEDADSEGAEGKFYLWREEQLHAALAPEQAEIAVRAFGVRREGNFTPETGGEPTGENILYHPRPLVELATGLGMTEANLRAALGPICQRLRLERELRPRPLRDEKILTDWNGLMIAALAMAWGVTGDDRHLEAARRATDFVLTTMCAPRWRLLHRYCEGEAAIPGLLDDYAFMVWGLIELHQATQELSYLDAATRLNRTMLERFWDERDGGLFLTADDAEQLLVRRKEVYDGAIPSGNSVAMGNFLRLSRLTGETELEWRAAQIAQAFSGQVASLPSAHAMLLCALDLTLGPSREIVIADRALRPETQAMLDLARRPGRWDITVLLRTEANAQELSRLAPFTEPCEPAGDQPTAHICEGGSCHLRTTDPAEVALAVGG